MSALTKLGMLLAVITIVLGLALLTITIAEGGGEVGILVGLLFTVAGGGRLYLARRG